MTCPTTARSGGASPPGWTRPLGASRRVRRPLRRSRARWSAASPTVSSTAALGRPRPGPRLERGLRATCSRRSTRTPGPGTRWASRGPAYPRGYARLGMVSGSGFEAFEEGPARARPTPRTTGEPARCSRARSGRPPTTRRSCSTRTGAACRTATACAASPTATRSTSRSSAAAPAGRCWRSGWPAAGGGSSCSRRGRSGIPTWTGSRTRPARTTCTGPRSG